MDITKLTRRFNKAADHSYRIASDRTFLAFAFAAGVLTLPFSASAALTCMAAPTLYAGFGLASKGMAVGLEKMHRKPSPPGT